MVSRIIVFSGTTEGREVTEGLLKLKREDSSFAGISVTVSVATEYGSEDMGDTGGAEVIYGRKDEKELKELVRQYDAVVDATHPYAELVTKYLKEACEETGTPYFRVKRAESLKYKDTVRVRSVSEAAEYLRGTEGNILLTTGSKELSEYGCLAPERLIARVLPLGSSLEACRDAGIPGRNIIAAQGPFSREFNEAIMKQYNIKYMVTKDGGAAGGFPEKMEAADACRVTAVVIERPEDEGLAASVLFERLKGL